MITEFYIIINNQMKLQNQYCKGFLLTCQQNRQKQAIKDAYNFLNQFIQKLYPDLQETQNNKKIKLESQNKQQPINSAPKSLQQEIKMLQKKDNRILYNLDTNVKCLIFIKINPIYMIDPVKIVLEIMKQMKDQSRQLTRYCHKILPVQRAFKAQFFKMKDVIQQLLEQKTKKGQKRSWALNFKCRNNDKFKYKEILKQVTQLANRFGHFGDIYYPEWTISIEIVHHLMCITICEQYRQNNEFKLRKINKVIQDIKQLKEEKQQQRQNQTEKKQIVVQKKCKEQIKNIQQRKPKQSKLLVQKIQIQEDDVDLF